MTRPTTTASPWPRHFAYLAAAILSGASGAINTQFGFSKGDTLAGSLTWAAVAAAVAVVLALSMPALIRSLEARRWSAALMALLALLLSGTYSLSAALGSAAGGRQNAATAEMATTDARKRLQGAYDAAKAELDTLKPTRASGELEALIAGAKPVCHIVVTVNRRDTVCGPPPTLVAELGRAKRRVELEAKIDTASAELAKVQPPRVANSDAKALQRYLLAVGVDITPERLNDLLVLLSVLMIEVGGSLALAIGIALGEAPAGRTAAPASELEQPQAPALNALNTPGAAIETLPAPVFKPSVQLRSDRAPAVQSADIVGLVRGAGGTLRTTTRRLGVQLGRPAASVHGELRRLAMAGLISLNADSRGTLITMGPAARPN